MKFIQTTRRLFDAFELYLLMLPFTCKEPLKKRTCGATLVTNSNTFGCNLFGHFTCSAIRLWTCLQVRVVTARSKET